MDHTALVIIDMQKAYFNNDALETRRAELTEACNQLIEHAKANDMPAFHLITKHERDGSTWTLNMLEDGQGYLFEGDEDSEVIEGLETDGVTQLVKLRDSAFHGTKLLEELKRHDADTIILAGVSTHTCVFQTAADAYANNLKVILARDAVASHDARFHNRALELLAAEYRQPALSNQQILDLMPE